MSDCQFKPISTWPGKRRTSHQPSRFRASWGETLDQLRYELGKLRAKRIVIEIDLSEDQIRLDGWPKATAKPRYPGVIVSFEAKEGPLRFPCDTFDFWQDNLRAIAKSLEALRAVDRYGVTKRGEQYTGWKRLPFNNQTESKMTSIEAAELYVRIGGGDIGRILDDREYANEVYRRAVKACHPDVHGQAFEEDFKRLQEAKAVLGFHWEGK